MTKKVRRNEIPSILSRMQTIWGAFSNRILYFGRSIFTVEIPMQTVCRKLVLRTPVISKYLRLMKTSALSFPLLTEACVHRQFTYHTGAGTHVHRCVSGEGGGGGVGVLIKILSVCSPCKRAASQAGLSIASLTNEV